MLLHAVLGTAAAFTFVFYHSLKKSLPTWLPRLNPPPKTPKEQQNSPANNPGKDEIEYPPPRPAEKDILGGAGSFSALGARLFSPAPETSKTIGWIVDQGSDFPPTVTSLIDSWETSVLVRHDPARLTTRGWNGYVDDQGTRAFKYTTPKKRLTAEDLSGTPLLHSRAFHMVCSPDRCRELVGAIVALRKKEALAASDDDDSDSGGGGGGGYIYSKPLIIWEPVPDRCTPDELLNLTNTLPLVDVCSPNHAELAAFMGDSGVDPDTGAISAAAVERACEQLLGSMPLSSFALVIRAGELGCYVARNGGRRQKPKTKSRSDSSYNKNADASKRRRKALAHHGAMQPDTDMMSLFAGLLQQSSDDGEEEGEQTFSFIHDDDDGEADIDPGLDRWLPAYWMAEQSDKVVDPTGGGNMFLGGLAVAMARGRCMEEAASWGSVAASFAIEQVGVPQLGRDAEGEETWNGVRVKDRLTEFYERIGWAAVE